MFLLMLGFSSKLTIESSLSLVASIKCEPSKEEGSNSYKEWEMSRLMLPHMVITS